MAPKKLILLHIKERLEQTENTDRTLEQRIRILWSCSIAVETISFQSSSNNQMTNPTEQILDVENNFTTCKAEKGSLEIF